MAALLVMLFIAPQPQKSAGELSPLVNALATEPDNLHSISGTQSPASSLSGHMVPNCSPSSPLRLAVSPWPIPGLTVGFPRLSECSLLFSWPGLSGRTAISSLGFSRPWPHPALPSWEDHFLFVSQCSTTRLLLLFTQGQTDETKGLKSAGAQAPHFRV